MELPQEFSNSHRNVKAVEELLERVRGLDQDARDRLENMLDDEMDLPFLDVMEREYAKAFRRIVPDHANQLRGQFVSALNRQREILIGLVRQAIQDANHQEQADPNQE